MTVRRSTTALALSLLTAAAPACTHWVAVPPADVLSGKVEIRTRQARVALEHETAELRVDRVASPYLEGWQAAAHKEVRVDLGAVRELSVELPDYQASAVAGYLATVGGLLLIGALAVFGQCLDGECF